MPRKHHSPSSLATATLCERKWGYQYLEGIRTPELTWAEIEAGAPHSNGQRSRALGTAVHAVLEAWYRGEDPAWSTFPGQVALAGAHYLPHPSKLAAPARVEQWLGLRTTPKLVGKVDLRVLPSPEESARLGLPHGWVTVDYKTSRDLGWCKSVAELEADGQLNVYALDAGTDPALMRWLYFDTGNKRRAKPVDVVRTYTQASTHVDGMLNHARHLDTLESVEECTPNPDSCGAFGGCEFHKSRGGPCDAQRRPGKIIQARIIKDNSNMLGKFGAGFRSQVQAAAAPTPAPVAPPAPAPAPAPEAPPVMAPPFAAAPPPAPAPEPPPAPVKAGPGRPKKVTITEPAPTAEYSGVRMTVTITGAPDEVGAVLEKLYA